MDFSVNVNVHTTGKEQINQLENQIKSLKNQSITVKTNLENGNLKQQINQFTQQVNRGLSSNKVSLTNAIDYGKTQKKIDQITKSVSRAMSSNITDVTTKQTDKWASGYVKQAQTQAKELKSTYQKQLKDYYGFKKKYQNALKSGNQNQASNFYSQLKDAKKQLSDTRKQLGNFLSKNELNNFSKQSASQYRTPYLEYQSKIADASVKATQTASQRRIAAINKAKKEESIAYNKMWDEAIKENKAYDAQAQKMEEQNNKAIQKAESAKSRIDAQQRITVLKTNAANKNARHNEIVQQGRENIANWKKQYQEQAQNQAKLQESFLKSQENLSSITSKEFQSSLSKYSGSNGYEKIQNYIKNAQELENALNKHVETRFSNISTKEFNSNLSQMNNLVGKANKEFTRLEQPVSQLISTRAGNNTLNWLQNNTRATKEYGEALISLANQQKSATTKGEQESLANQVRVIQSNAKLNGLTGNSIFSEIKRGIKQVGQFALTYGGIQKIQSEIINSISELKNIDTILTEISKTSDLTDAEIQEIGKTSFSKASRWGKTATDYLTGIQEMSRSGFYGKQAEDMANLSVLAEAAGDMSADTANNYLLATNAAYQYEGNVEKLNAALDGQNEITNRNSVSMDDMASATSKAASMAAQTGVSIEQLSAMIGTIEARTKTGGNEVGNSIKALLVNLQNVGSDKITGTLQKAGASMTKFANGTEQLRNPISILNDLAETYNNLSDTDPLKQEILTNIGQKYHANKLAALLTGWDDYKKMLTDYSEGVGSAEEEAEKSANNWQGNLNKLSNSFTELVGNVVNSGEMTTIIKGLNTFTNAITGVTSSTGALGTLLMGIGAYQGFKNKDNIKNVGGKSIVQSYNFS